MPKRRNAGLGMARVTELVHEVAMDYQPDAVGAVGHMEVYPNSRNIIAGKTVFTIDIRSPEKEVLDEMDGRIRDGIATICEALDIKFEIEQVGHFDPVTFDKDCVKAIRDAAERLGYTHRNIVSGAGHDACWINRVAPTAMVMCPCVDGLSHNEAEEIFQGMGGRRLRRAVPRGGGDGGDRGVSALTGRRLLMPLPPGGTADCDGAVLKSPLPTCGEERLHRASAFMQWRLDSFDPTNASHPKLQRRKLIGAEHDRNGAQSALSLRNCKQFGRTMCVRTLSCPARFDMRTRVAMSICIVPHLPDDVA